MKYLGIFLLFSAFFITKHQPVHQYKIQALDSEEIIDLKSFAGKKMLLVNVASKCGYTPQYEDLERLYQTYKDNLVVIGFPCNQFLGQEKGTESEIRQFCRKNYGVTFPMTQKINVKGKKQHEIYQWLTHKELNGHSDNKVSWNFNKFLIDENGYLVEHFGSKVKPFDEAIVRHLEK